MQKRWILQLRRIGSMFIVLLLILSGIGTSTQEEFEKNRELDKRVQKRIEIEKLRPLYEIKDEKEWRKEEEKYHKIRVEERARIDEEWKNRLEH